MRRSAIHYSTRELAFLEARRTMPRRALYRAFVKAFARTDVTCDHIKALCTRRGWTTNRARWSAAQDARLRTLYPDTATPYVARRIGRSVCATYGRARLLGLRKSAAYLASPAACRLRRGDNVGAAYRFQKGIVPANKGLRRPGWAPGRMRETQFTKGARSGQAARNWRPIGSERVVDGYRYTKIDDRRNVPYTVNWKPTHVLRWQALHGVMPKGMALKCLDGNKENTDPSNWTLIPRAILPRLNGGRVGRLSYDDAPVELKPVILAAAQLEHAARERKKVRAS